MILVVQGSACGVAQFSFCSLALLLRFYFRSFTDPKLGRGTDVKVTASQSNIKRHASRSWQSHFPGTKLSHGMDSQRSEGRAGFLASKKLSAAWLPYTALSQLQHDLQVHTQQRPTSTQMQLQAALERELQQHVAQVSSGASQLLY
jgi:hypothetical protein